jgi:hypothetical protein
MDLNTDAIARKSAPADDARLRRWCVLAIVGAILLGIYVATLSWATRQVEAGVDRSLQPLPAVIQDRPGG